MIWLLGVILLLLGIFLIISSFLARERTENLKLPETPMIPSFPEYQEKERKFGGVVLIGPIPIVFGNTKLAIVALILAIILMLLSIVFLMRWYV
ncbi:MAG: TIGR00304 family protein [Archaeoglobaceae archaeon]|nr:TIGR00304 family protein [Archaeoglobaceae archaeon]MDW8117804.1 TIGR00304 family protein [Archaeoglobaceae archaeon]